MTPRACARCRLPLAPGDVTHCARAWCADGEAGWPALRPEVPQPRPVAPVPWRRLLE